VLEGTRASSVPMCCSTAHDERGVSLGVCSEAYGNDMHAASKQDCHLCLVTMARVSCGNQGVLCGIGTAAMNAVVRKGQIQGPSEAESHVCMMVVI
jgi:hypothetical protein